MPAAHLLLSLIHILAGGNVAIALLANTIATGAALVALILTFGPISGAHLNPAVTLADAMEQGIPWLEAAAYIGVQCAGGVVGAIIAHLMFGLRWYSAVSYTHLDVYKRQRITSDNCPRYIRNAIDHVKKALEQ